MPMPPSPSWSSITYSPKASPGFRPRGSGSLAIGASISTGVGSRPPMAGRRLTAYYIVLLAAVAVVATYVLSVGAETEPQPAIAGGYDVSPGEACLGDQVDLRQSGQFVSMQRADGSTVGKLRFENDRLTGDVSCLEGGTQPLEAEHSGQRFVGTVGDERAAARLRPRPAGPRRPEAGAAREHPRRLQVRPALRLPGRKGRADRPEQRGRARGRRGRARRAHVLRGQSQRHGHLRRRRGGGGRRHRHQPRPGR